LRACLHDLAEANRVTFAYRATLRWLGQFASSANAETPLHLIDIGCGGGDMLRTIERWAALKQIPLRLTGIDTNPDCIRAAAEFTPPESKIQWVTGSAYTFDAFFQPVDLVISSLFTHHLQNDEILRFLRWMEQTARRGWFINDLYRNPVAYFGFKALSAAAAWHRFVRHDGPVSIRRGFLPREWRAYLKDSGFSAASFRIESHWPARLCVARVKSG
jgi:SAM-dependent methyltransferase